MNRRPLPEKLYYRIGEVADYIGVEPSTLRFWEKEFPQIKPKRKNNERFYRPEDVRLFELIHYLLKEEKYTIEGAKKKLKLHRKLISDNKEMIEILEEFKRILLDIKKRI